MAHFDTAADLGSFRVSLQLTVRRYFTQKPQPEPAFTTGNEYLFVPTAFTWNLPSGFTCPGAVACLTYADEKTGAITNGKDQTFKCYSAVTERFPAVRERSWANWRAVQKKSPEEVARTIDKVWNRKARYVRIHAGGDFFSQDYFDGWLIVCRNHPKVRFWAFTKSLPFWLARLGEIPPNLNLQASYGGKYDDLIELYGLKSARVVYSREEATELGLKLDTDDILAAYGDASFALMENFTNKRGSASRSDTSQT